MNGVHRVADLGGNVYILYVADLMPDLNIYCYDSGIPMFFSIGMQVIKILRLAGL